LEWLRDLHDGRIKIYASPQNLGIVKNWRRIAEIPRGEFMTFCGQDDLLDSNYLEVIDSLIHADPQASLYFTHFRQIDKDGKLIRHSRSLPYRETAAEFLAAMLSGKRDSGNSGYVMRSELYDRVGGIPPFPGLLFADDALWIKLASHSWKSTAKEECISCRQHTESAGATAGMTWIDGIGCYIDFLEETSRHNPEIGHAYKTCAPDYFYSVCRNTSIHGFNKSTRRNKRFERSLEKELLDYLFRVSPQKARQLRKDPKLRLYKYINTNRIVRKIVCHFLRWRDGDVIQAKSHQ